MKAENKIAFDLCAWLLMSIFFFARIYVLCFLRGTSHMTRAQRMAIFTITMAYVLGTAILFTDIWMCSQIIDRRNGGEALVPSLGAPMSLAVPVLKVLAFDTVAYLCIIWLVKLSLLAIYYDIAPRLSDKMRYILHAAFGFTAATGVAAIIVNLSWCRPYRRLWAIGMPEFCSPSTTLEYPISLSALHLLTDVIVFAIPIFILRTLHLRKNQTVAIIFVFAVGTTTIAVAVTRLAIQVETIHQDSNAAGSFPLPEVIWLSSVAEFAVGVVCACLPSTRALLRKMGIIGRRDRTGGFSNKGFSSKTSGFWSTNGERSQIEGESSLGLGASGKQHRIGTETMIVSGNHDRYARGNKNAIEVEVDITSNMNTRDSNGSTVGKGRYGNDYEYPISMGGEYPISMGRNVDRSDSEVEMKPFNYINGHNGRRL